MFRPTVPRCTDSENAGRAIRVAGGCHMDVLGRSADRYEAATSCPGSVGFRAGGVARNVACLLGRAGRSVRFSSVVGSDDQGQRLLSDLASAGVDTSLTLPRAGARTGTYLAIHDEAGELVSAISDLGIYDDYTPPAALMTPLAGDLAFADANLPESALARLAEAFGPGLSVDAISRAKAPRLKAVIGSGALVVCNLRSSGTLTGVEVATPALAAAQLRAMGVQRAVVTGGALPIAVIDHGVMTELTPETVGVRDVTGTGDAQIAGMLLGLSADLTLVDAVGVGMLAARAALQTEGALDRLPASLVDAVAVRRRQSV